LCGKLTAEDLDRTVNFITVRADREARIGQLLETLRRRRHVEST